LGAALVPFSSAPAEAEGRCSNRPALNNRRCTEEAICHATETQLCACARTVSGNRRCIDISGGFEGLCSAEQCERNRDCAEGEVCVRLGACCGVEGLQVCARPCVIT
jgi:hypothetical protein